MNVTFNRSTKTLVNHDLDKIYTFGKRGKRPNWVLDWIKYNPDEFKQLQKDSQPVQPVKPEDIEYELIYDKETETLSNVTLEKTYTFGQRGKKPSWVKNWIDNQNQTEITEKNIEKSDNKNPFDKNNKKQITLREWHFRSEMNNQCIIVANDDIQAIYLLNKIFKYKYTAKQFEVFFKETDYVSGFDVGVWKWNDALNNWEPYKDYKNSQKSC